MECSDKNGVHSYRAVNRQPCPANELRARVLHSKNEPSCAFCHIVPHATCALSRAYHCAMTTVTLHKVTMHILHVAHTNNSYCLIKRELRKGTYNSNPGLQQESQEKCVHLRNCKSMHKIVMFKFVGVNQKSVSGSC